MDDGFQLAGGGRVEEAGRLLDADGGEDQAVGEAERLGVDRVELLEGERLGPAEGPDPHRPPRHVHVALGETRFEERLLVDHGNTPAVTVSVVCSEAVQRIMSPTGADRL